MVSSKLIRVVDDVFFLDGVTTITKSIPTASYSKIPVTRKCVVLSR